jgi:hypothetical protein
LAFIVLVGVVDLDIHSAGFFEDVEFVVKAFHGASALPRLLE